MRDFTLPQAIVAGVAIVSVAAVLITMRADVATVAIIIQTVLPSVLGSRKETKEKQQ